MDKVEKIASIVLPNQLFEKSPVKRAFLQDVRKKLSINAEILGNIYEDFTDTDYIVSRAFKKFTRIKIKKNFGLWNGRWVSWLSYRFALRKL